MVKQQDCLNLALLIAQESSKAKLKIATAESCSGGWMAKIFTDLPGSSNWYQGGVVAYSNHLKSLLTKVNPHTLEAFGSVSEPVVREMARYLTQHAKAHIGFAVSGIAGPEKRPLHQRQKPIGEVCFCWSMNSDYLYSETVHFSGNREAIRLQSVFYGLSGIHQLLLPTR